MIPASSSASTSSQRFSWREPGHVRVGELVDESDLGPAGDDRVDVHLLERRAAVLDACARHDLEAADLLGGLRAAVRLDEADDDVGAALGAPATLAEHRERLADAGSGPEVDAERSPCHG